MKPEHHQNQDTNDRYLANIQRDGTFSVVPRIAAGEVSPEGLIAIGQIAKKYKLYTKVRSGFLPPPGIYTYDMIPTDYGRPAHRYVRRDEIGPSGHLGRTQCSRF